MNDKGKLDWVFQLGGKGKGMCPKKMKNNQQNCPQLLGNCQ